MTVLGVSRGTAKLGSATVIDGNGRILVSRLELEGAGFAAEMARLRQKIAKLQQQGRRTEKVFRLRGRKANAIIGSMRIVSSRSHLNTVRRLLLRGWMQPLWLDF